MANAEDCVQEAFSRALKYIDSWSGVGPMHHWVNIILNNCTREFLNTERLQGGLKEPVAEVNEDGEVDLQDVVFHEQMAGKIQDEMRMKGEQHEKVLQDYIILGFSSREIAEYIDMTAANIRQVVKRFKDEMVVIYGEDMRSGSRS